MANYSTSDFSLTPKVEAILLDAIQTTSGFQSASKLVQLNGAGVIISTLAPSTAAWVGEGEEKPVVKGAVSEVTLSAKKIAKIVVMTDEASADIDGLVSALETEGAGSIGRTFDLTIAGEESGPVEISTLTGATPVLVDDRAGWVKAITPVRSGVGRSSVVMNEMMKFALMAIDNANGSPVYNIVENGEYSGTINGIPYNIFYSESTEPVGFVGPFATKAYWGAIPGFWRIEKLVGGYNDENGKAQFFGQNNEFGILVEGRFGYAVENLNLFKELTFTPAV